MGGVSNSPMSSSTRMRPWRSIADLNWASVSSNSCAVTEPVSVISTMLLSGLSWTWIIAISPVVD
jgi:hypothetical protein